MSSRRSDPRNLIYDHGDLLPALELELVDNTPPVALDDSMTVPEDAGLTNIVVLDNDTDALITTP